MILKHRQIEQLLDQRALFTCRDPNVPQLTVTLKSLFSLPDDLRQRWANEHPVVGAKVSLGGLLCVADGDGKAYFDVADLGSGPLPLQVDPPDGMDAGGDEEAGPLFAAGTLQADMPATVFRSFTGTLTVAAGQFDTSTNPDQPPCRLAGGILHARIFSIQAEDVTIDYKPDFVRAHASQAFPEGRTVRWIVLHRTSSSTADIGPTLYEFTRARADTSAHYVIDRDGFIVKMVQETSAAWHAGCSLWQGTRDLNPSTVGIEVVALVGANEDATLPLERFTPEQDAAIIRLGGALLDHYGLSRHDVVGHADINTQENAQHQCVGFSLGGNRVRCPGKEMNWPYLARNGVGTLSADWQAMAGSVQQKYHGLFDSRPPKVPRLQRGDHDDPARPVYGGVERTDLAGTDLVKTLRGDLLTLGYTVSQDFSAGRAGPEYRNGEPLAAPYEAATQEAVKVFQRHFMQRGGSAVSWYFEADIAMALEAALGDLGNA